jgi:hypothetical protein
MENFSGKDSLSKCEHRSGCVLPKEGSFIKIYLVLSSMDSNDEALKMK